MDFRAKNPNASPDELSAKMGEIKDRQDTIKGLDEQVNEVFDEMKENMSEFVTENIDEATGASEFAEKMQEKGVEWFKENGGDRVKRGIENLEWMKEKYDKASEQYEQISAQIEKLKKVYDEATEIYGKIDKVNKLVAEGKLDKGKAGVLHGAILLGKGLEYSTKYVPVFGSTISKISKATFEETVKFATKRAQRTVALDKCIDDPEHCDTEGITGY
jgi:DNA repair exonuclease SbcCD ATPase subunit